jgi:four helix bundle protein
MTFNEYKTHPIFERMIHMLKTNQPAFSKNFKNLISWQKGMDLIKEIYKITALFPDSERFALKSQIHRSSTSICLNLAEGNGQLFPKKEINFFNNALGSCSETICALDIALLNQYIDQEKHDELEQKIVEIQKLIIGYIRKLQQSISEYE